MACTSAAPCVKVADLTYLCKGPGAAETVLPGSCVDGLNLRAMVQSESKYAALFNQLALQQQEQVRSCPCTLSAFRRNVVVWAWSS